MPTFRRKNCLHLQGYTAPKPRTTVSSTKKMFENKALRISAPKKKDGKNYTM
jgi:hypothetical protein